MVKIAWSYKVNLNQDYIANISATQDQVIIDTYRNKSEYLLKGKLITNIKTKSGIISDDFLRNVYTIVVTGNVVKVSRIIRESYFKNKRL